MKFIRPSECGISKWADLVATKDNGYQLYRVTDFWLDRITRRVTPRAQEPSGIQLNFITNSKFLLIELVSACAMGDSPILSIFVNGLLQEYTLKPGPLRHRIELKFEEDGEKCIKVVFPRHFETTLYDLGFDSEARVTAIDDTRKTICFVGDSITQGASSSKSIVTYPYLVAEHLNFNYINMGMSGACFPDPMMAIYLSTKLEWDILSIAMGTNSFGLGHESPIEYGIMYGAYLDILRANCKDKPIICITPIWRGNADGEGKKTVRGAALEDFREAIRREVWSRQEDDINLYLVEGTTLIFNENGLSVDLLHPNDKGMQIMTSGIVDFINNRLKF